MRSLSFLVVLIFVFIFSPTHSIAQAVAQTAVDNCQDNRGVCAYQKPLNDLLNAAKQGNDKAKSDALSALLAPEQVPDYFVLARSEGSVFDTVVNAWERSRVDKQMGPSQKGPASTDLVSRPSTSELLGLALQTGALTESVSGSAATFNANAYGAYKAIVGQPSICLACSPSAWKNLNFSASFDLNRQSPKQVPTTGVANSTTPPVGMVQLPQGSRQLSSITVRYDIYNPLDPRSKEFKKAWSTAFQKHQPELAKIAEDLDKALLVILKPLIEDNESLGKIQEKYRPKLEQDAAADDATALKSDFEKFFKELTELADKNIPDLDTKLAAAAAAYARFSQINYTVVQEARGKP